jgi:hypothetical protein
MPSWTLSDIVSNATAGLGNRSEIALSTASFWANEAQRQVWDAMPHDLAEVIAISSTTVNEDKIAFPTDFQELLHVSSLSAGGNEPLEQINIENAVSWSTATGEPTHYLLYADWLELRPIPDSAYSIQLRYRKQLSDMTALAAHPSVSTRLRYAVFLKTKELLADNVIRSPELAAEAQAQYLSYMRSTPSDRALKQRENRFAALSLPRARGETPGTTTTSYDFDTADG